MRIRLCSLIVLATGCATALAQSTARSASQTVAEAVFHEYRPER